MKYFLITFSFIFSLLIAKENTALLKVNGMVCSYSCAGKVNSVVQKIDGVKDSSVDFNKGIATIKYDGSKIADKDIVETLKNKTMYKVSIIDSKNDKYPLEKI